MGPRLRRNGCFLAPLLLEELVGETGTVLLDAGAGTLAVTINGGTAHVLFNDTCPAKDGSQPWVPGPQREHLRVPVEAQAANSLSCAQLARPRPRGSLWETEAPDACF